MSNVLRRGDLHAGSERENEGRRQGLDVLRKCSMPEALPLRWRGLAHGEHTSAMTGGEIEWKREGGTRIERNQWR